MQILQFLLMMLIMMMMMTTLTARRIIDDYMVYHELESSNLTIAVKLLSYVKQARSRYFNNQKERFTQRVQSGRNDKMKQINDDIDDANRNIRQQQDTRNSPKTSVDKYASEAEGKSTIAEIKNLISKSNALKRAATEKKKSAIFPC